MRSLTMRVGSLVGPLLLLACAGGCDSRHRSQSGNGAPEGIELALAVVDGAAGAPPKAIRVTFKNATGDTVSFEEPSPQCPEATPEGHTLLGLALTDSKGRESPWTPVLTELFRANLSDPKTLTLKPHESRSIDVDLEQFYVWGSCGPASPISELLRPDPDGVQLHAWVASRPGAPLRSPPIRIPFTIPGELFGDPGSVRTEVKQEESEEGRRRSHESLGREERRRHEAALRAVRRELSRVGKEPESEGKPLSEWLAEYSDPDLQFAEERSPEEARLRKAEDAILEIGAAAVPFLMRALEVEYEVSKSAAKLLHRLYEGGKAPDSVFVSALRGGSEAVQRGVLEALDPGDSLGPGHKAPVLPSQDLIEALGELIQDGQSSVLFGGHKVPVALGRPGLKAAIPVLIKALSNSDESIRAGAARALAVVGPDAKESIPALKTLSQAADRLASRSARTALIALGEKLPDLANSHERLAQYFHDRVVKEPIAEFSEATLGPWLSGADGVFFVVDRSGSSTEGFEFSQRYIPEVLRSMKDTGEFGIVFVDRGTRSFPEGEKPRKCSREEISAAVAFVLKMEGGVASCPTDGFNAALGLAAASSARRKVILYIGDGGGTCRGQPEADYLERMCEEVAQKNAGLAEIHAIGAGASQVCEAALLKVTERNGGTYRRLVKS